jgi:hypothetical protein
VISATSGFAVAIFPKFEINCETLKMTCQVLYDMN